MCRIFGFRSVIQSQVHHSLVEAENALHLQSNEHPDGWGVAYYVANTPHIVKSEGKALEDSIFKKISGVVASETVIAHIRRSTVGENNILNTHPFQFGRWVFAHNGHIKDFEKHRPAFMAQIQPKLRRYILGDTDSEVLFYLLMSQLALKVDINEKDCDVEALAEATRNTNKIVTELAGNFANEDTGVKDDNYFTFILSNGESMIAFHGGKHLYYSTYKTRCVERDSCPSFAPECEAASTSGFVNHLIFSSEPLSGDNIWLPVEPGTIMGIDGRMKLSIY